MSARILDPQTFERIVKLLGMTSSRHDGEVVNAARMADRLLRANGLQWADIICVPCAEPREEQQPDDLGDGDFWDALVNQLYAARHLLRPRDRHFVESMSLWEGTPTPAQQKWLLDIWRRRR